MTSRVTMVCHGMTAATRRAAFPADEPLERTPSLQAPPADLAVCSPATRCRQTAAALGLEPVIDERLRDCDYGRWTGLTLDEVSATELGAVEAWLSDPAASPHGGESIVDMVARVGAWLDGLPPGRVVAITHAAVIKAAIVHAIRANPESFWRIDVPPLSRVELTGPVWRLRFQDAFSFGPP
jgi:broad specificity phosphatase PhoE